MNEDSIQEKHKSHRGTREKIKKKRKQEKEHQKSKKIKKKEYELNKPEKQHHKKHKSSKNSIKIPKLLKILPKFLNVFADDIENFYGIFDMLDKGESVNISGLENVKIQKKLKKIFKYLRLIKSEDDEYTKNPNIHTFNLRAKIKELVELSFFKESSSSSSESGEDDSENEDNDEKLKKVEKNKDKNERNKEKVEKPSKNKEKEVLNKLPNEKNLEEPEKMQEETTENAADNKKKVYGVQFISPEEKAKFLETVLPPPIERETWLAEDNLSKMIDSSFNKIPKHAPAPGKRVPKYLATLFDKEPDKMKFMEAVKMDNTSEKELKEQEDIKEYMKTYDEANNRGKSLLEMHKQKLQEKKKGKTLERREFNRDTDLRVIRHDSKKVFAMINEGDNSLGNRFKNSKFERSFL